MNDLLRTFQLPEEPLRKRFHAHPALRAFKRLMPKEILEDPYDAILHLTLMDGVELTPASHPVLFRLVREVAGKYGLERRFRLFRVSEGDGTILSTASNHTELFIQFPDQTLNQMKEKHLRHLLGHELGHTCFGHYDDVLHVAFLGMLNRELSPAEERFMERKDFEDFCDIACILSQIQELNADRAGLLATGDLSASLEAEILAQVDGPDAYGTPDPDAVLRQAEELTARSDYMDERLYLAGVTQSCLAIRVLALQRFWYSEVCDPIRKGKGRYRGDYCLDNLNRILPLSTVGI